MGKKVQNTMIIDSKKGVYFDDTPGNDTIPMVCRNNGKEYDVLMVKSGKKENLDLPDGCHYYDPGEYANVLGMPAHKKLFERRQTLLQNLAPWVLVAIIAILGILTIIAMG